MPTKKSKHSLRFKRNTTKRCKKIKNKYKHKFIGGVSEEFGQKQSLLSQQLTNPVQRQSKMLNAVCNETTRGACLDFMSEYRTMIKNFFNNYYIKPRDKSPSYATTIKRIGNESSNGFVLQVEYERDGYKSYSAIKINRKRDDKKHSDSLLYEYYVGINFINHYLKVFPCFVETYKQLYFLNKPADHKFMFNITKNGIPFDSTFKSHINEDDNPERFTNDINELVNNACKFGKQDSLAIMLQHFDNFASFADMADNHIDDIKYDIPNLTLQIYFVLNALSSVYTHYDLHSNNVYLYKPYLGKKYILMNYHFKDGVVVSFPTEYIAKIIDYGRNYIYNPETKKNSKDFYSNLCMNCKAEECISYDKNKDGVVSNLNMCGETTGVFLGEYPDDAYGSFYYINPSKKNASHDLRFASDPQVKNYFAPLSGMIPDHAINFLYREHYGTPERLTKSTAVKEINGKKRLDIIDVYSMTMFLKLTVNGWNDLKFNEWKTGQPDVKYNKYGKDWTKMGEMHVYEDQRPYEFIATAQTT